MRRASIYICVAVLAILLVIPAAAPSAKSRVAVVGSPTANTPTTPTTVGIPLGGPVVQPQSGAGGGGDGDDLAGMTGRGSHRELADYTYGGDLQGVAQATRVWLNYFWFQVRF
jgi:hypothetical protein